MELSRVIYIKDLLILQSPIIFSMIKLDLDRALNAGVSIGELALNPFIYQTRSLNVSYLSSYIKSLANLSCSFRSIFDDYLFHLRSEYDIQNFEENYCNISNEFQILFNSVNNAFNQIIVDQDSFEDFGIYQEEISVDAITALYNSFNESFKFIIKKYTGIDISPYINKYILKYIYNIYDNIFEQFEPIYLPFY